MKRADADLVVDLVYFFLRLGREERERREKEERAKRPVGIGAWSKAAQLNLRLALWP